MSTSVQCEIAKERYGPGKMFKLADYKRHVASCKECAKLQRQLKREQSRRTAYSSEFPIEGAHRYLLIVPAELWKRLERRADSDNVSTRSVLLRLIQTYCDVDATPAAPKKD